MNQDTLLYLLAAALIGYFIVKNGKVTFQYSITTHDANESPSETDFAAWRRSCIERLVLEGELVRTAMADPQRPERKGPPLALVQLQPAERAYAAVAAAATAINIEEGLEDGMSDEEFTVATAMAAAKLIDAAPDVILREIALPGARFCNEKGSFFAEEKARSEDTPSPTDAYIADHSWTLTDWRVRFDDAFNDTSDEFDSVEEAYPLAYAILSSRFGSAEAVRRLERALVRYEPPSADEKPI